MKQKTRFWLLRWLGPVLLALLLFRTDTQALLEILAGAKLLNLIGAFLLILPILFLRTVRWRSLLFPHAPAYGESLALYGFGVFAGTFTPGQVGEYGKAYFLSKRGVPLGKAVYATLLDRILDFVFLLTFAGLFLPGLPLSTPVYVVLAALLGFVLAFMGQAIGGEVFNRPLFTWMPWHDKFCAILDKIGSNRVPNRQYGTAAFNSVLCWLLNWVAISLLAASIGLKIPFVFVCGVMATCSLLSAIPISVLGIGTRDAALIFFLGSIGHGEPAALALSGLVLALRLAYMIPCALAVFFTKVSAS